MVVEQVGEVGRGLIVLGFVSKGEDFELDALTDREPVEAFEDRGDMVMGAGVGEEAGKMHALRFVSCDTTADPKVIQAFKLLPVTYRYCSEETLFALRDKGTIVVFRISKANVDI